MSLIPRPVAERMKARARKGSRCHLENLLDVRDLIAEIYRPQGKIMQAYSDAAVAMECSADTVRLGIGQIREYTDKDLFRWLDSGISFDHLSAANSLAELANKTPIELIEQAIDPGNAEGNTMTVRELEAFALGERKQNHPVFRFGVLLGRLLKFPNALKWDDEKTGRYMALLEELKGFFK